MFTRKTVLVAEVSQGVIQETPRLVLVRLTYCVPLDSSFSISGTQASRSGVYVSFQLRFQGGYWQEHHEQTVFSCKTALPWLRLHGIECAEYVFVKGRPTFSREEHPITGQGSGCHLWAWIRAKPNVQTKWACTDDGTLVPWKNQPTVLH